MSSPPTEVTGQPRGVPGPPPGDPDAYLWPRPEDFPNLNELVLEDGKPVDNIFSEKQQRLLTESLHAGWTGPPGGQPFVVMANVGVFHTTGEPPLVPDVLLAVGVRQGDLKQRENLAYFVWLRGKAPDVVIEIVSNREGGEDSAKLQKYARMGVPYYVVFDPQHQLGEEVLRVFQLRGRTYHALTRPLVFAEVGLGVDLWQGRFEDVETTWLRWFDQQGHVLPTGAERTERERQRAELEHQRAELERQRAELERQRAEGAEQRAAVEHRAAERAVQELTDLREKLRGMGISLPP